MFRPERFVVARRRTAGYGWLAGGTRAERRLLSMQTMLVQQTTTCTADDVAELALRSLAGGTLVAENIHDSTKWVWPVGALIISDRLAEAERIRAEAEAQTYAAAIPEEPDRYLGLAQAFALFDAPGDGAEVFSLLRESRLAAEDYLDAFFDTGSERLRVL